jgi:hypothetical protein
MPRPCACPYEDVLLRDDYEEVTRFLKNDPFGLPGFRDGYTLLMVATKMGALNSMRALLDFGADPNAIDNEGGTAMYLAAEYDNAKAIALLVARKAEVDPVMSETKMTPLHAAAAAGNIAAASALIRAGADRNARLRSGYTPLALTHLGCFPAYKLRSTDPAAYNSLQKLLTPGAPVPPASAKTAGGSSSSSSSSGSVPVPAPAAASPAPAKTAPAKSDGASSSTTSVSSGSRPVSTPPAPAPAPAPAKTAGAGSGTSSSTSSSDSKAVKKKKKGKKKK